MGLVLFPVLLNPLEEAQIDKYQEKQKEVWLYCIEAKHLHRASCHNTNYISDLSPKHVPGYKLLWNALEIP